MNTQTKKQHFIPQFYLQGFANSREQVWAYRRVENKGPYQANIGDVCAMNYLYEISSSIPSEPQYIEQGTTEAFLSKFEDSIAPSIAFLRDYYPDESVIAAEDLWEHLYITCAFISNLITRNPKWLLPQRAHAKDLTRHLIATDFFSPDDISQLKELGYSSELSKIVELGIQHAELFSLEENSSMAKLGELFSEMSFLLLRAPSGSDFITSSFPLTVVWADKTTDKPDMAYFPLSSSSAFILKKEDNSAFFYNETSSEWVARLNVQLLAQHNLWDTAIAREKETLETCLAATA